MEMVQAIAAVDDQPVVIFQVVGSTAFCQELEIGQRFKEEKGSIQGCHNQPFAGWVHKSGID